MRDLGVDGLLVADIRLGQVRTTVTPSSTTFADFSAGTLTPGTHTVRIAFTNDARTSSEDRNLWLDLARS